MEPQPVVTITKVNQDDARAGGDNKKSRMNRLDPSLEALLLKNALEAKAKAYCVYSKFQVGAAILTSEGQIIQGCNIENASYGHTICAERTAICKAVVENQRKLVACMIVSTQDDFTSPCGACRQMLREFSDPEEMAIILANHNGDLFRQPLEFFLPMSFGPDNLLDDEGGSKF